MKSFFRGEDSSLFEGLQIYESGNNFVHNKTSSPWIKYPVIYLDFSVFTNRSSYSYVQKLKQFEDKLDAMLKEIAEEYDVDSGQPDFGLAKLIRKLKRKFNLPVIILIDEYDAPINNALHHGNSKSRKLALGIAQAINNLFVEMKASTEYLRFVWVTGVTPLGLIPAL
jgi:hypothetical protein